MRIVHWDEMFHPAFGYQINVLTKYQAMQGHEVIILTGEHPEEHPTFKGLNDGDVPSMDSEFERKYNVKIIRIPIFGVISGNVIYKPGYIKEIKELNPDVIMCHTNDTLSAITIAKARKSINKPIVFDNHMLAMASVNPLHRLFATYFRNRITPLIKKNNWTVIRTQDDPYIIEEFGVPVEQAPFISFGSDLTIFHPDEHAREKFRIDNKIKNDDFVVVYTGKLGEAKGGKLLAEVCSFKYSKDNIVFVIVGTARSEYEREVEQMLSNSPNRIIRFNSQNYTDLPQFYQMADLFLCPKQCSLSFYDAQACGLPAVVEDNNVNVERVSHNNGFYFQSGNAKAMRDEIDKCLVMEGITYQNMKNCAASFVKTEYGYDKIAEKYTQVMLDEIAKFKSYGYN
jgi:glycosyltransferase involved in cell wall biosynthesis